MHIVIEYSMQSSICSNAVEHLLQCNQASASMQSSFFNAHHHTSTAHSLEAHLLGQRGKGSNDVGDRLALLGDIVGAEMHGDDIGRVLLQPAHELLLVRDVDGQEARVSLIVTVLLGVSAVVLRLARPDKVDC